jgi:hypothetical protein
MSHRNGGSLLWPAVTRAGVGAAWLVVAMTGLAWPQAAPSPQFQTTPASPAPSSPPAPEAPSVAPAEPPRKENPGLINELGKLFSGSSPILPDMKNSGQAIDDFNARTWEATKSAAEAISRLTKSPGVTGRVACPIAPNGAPDCKAAADKLCQSKGFKEGRSVDMDSAETCSAKTLIPGRARKPGDCRTDNYVTRAICQ